MSDNPRFRLTRASLFPAVRVIRALENILTEVRSCAVN
jgi:hypothetical protein